VLRVQPNPEPDTSARGHSVALVEDDSGVREVCEDALLEAGFHVEAFRVGEDALRALAVTSPGVLVVDWKMPGLDGAQLARRARALDPGLPILMITGSRWEIEEAARCAGVRRVLYKPFLMEDLVAAVTALAGGATS